VDHRRQGIRRILAFKQPCAREQLVQHQAPGPDIGRLPLACSGDMYAAVPMTVPATVALRVTVGEFSGSKLAASGVSLNAFANPKSSNFTTPSGVTFTLDGFRSR
jgi:hypothetical protein